MPGVLYTLLDILCVWLRCWLWVMPGVQYTVRYFVCVVQVLALGDAWSLEQRIQISESYSTTSLQFIYQVRGGLAGFEPGGLFFLVSILSFYILY